MFAKYLSVRLVTNSSRILGNLTQENPLHTEKPSVVMNVYQTEMPIDTVTSVVVNVGINTKCYNRTKHYKNLKSSVVMPNILQRYKQ